MYKWFLFAILISLSLTCNNYCNGHGKCGANDKCACFMGWGGADCSLRSCPYDDAFVDVPLGDINHDGSVSGKEALDEWRPKGGIKEDLSDYVSSTRAHRYAECSNAGLCNRETGECECFAGYEGSACQRRSCPVSSDDKVCSGHGVCLTSTTIIHDNAGTGSAYYGWESEKYMSCLCDEGWEGIDCSLRQCPKGFDPVVLAGVTFNYRINGATSNSGLKDVAAKDFYLKFEYDGMVYESSVISPFSTNYPECDGNGKLTGNVDKSLISQITENIRRAIVSNVPYLNQATVSFVCGAEGTGGTANSPSSAGAADLLISTPHGDVKVFEKTKTTAIQVLTPATVTNANGVMVTSNNEKITVGNDGKISIAGSNVPSGDDATAAYALCSRRGICLSDSGECSCFTGYTGEACQYQRSIAI